jgi:hypothetical protein
MSGQRPQAGQFVVCHCVISGQPCRQLIAVCLHATDHCWRSALCRGGVQLGS